MNKWSRVNFFGFPEWAWVRSKEFWPKNGPKGKVWAQISGDEFNPFRWFTIWKEH